ncbi:1-deoxy-D-xylulose-5-phosphate reductoisomerase [Candidatus Paracaedibacter symbiosus]|uniref:1-deoxy-D-xylulose-5-phosphate reductoisomerase n=1 Tax=Candidatus Paracaedibacter symbiosus TaxID=244582 RepID=UPI0005096EF5|nr:1-deoxy-D-xylulose-5-phosphate reductoisomerase [Candidatus Paracaedibacter symbiosus]
MSAPQKISIFGATGSIGQSTLDLVGATPDAFKVIALTAQKNVTKLADAAIQTGAQYAVIADSSQYETLNNLLVGTKTTVLCGKEGLLEVAQIEVDTVISAVVGLAGLEMTYAAIPYCRKLALANKESIVAAGEQILALATEHSTKIVPVDSEHSAIFQVFEEQNRAQLNKLILTASGGPFRCLASAEFANITVEKALKHPNWDMGAKITIDCATLANKGLELIEAALLFNVPEHQIDVIVHPESIIHSLVAYQDGSTLAQLGMPDMRTAISYALGWPYRHKTLVKPLNLIEMGKLTFEAPDLTRFPALRLARQALKNCQGQRIIFNTANEIAVENFLNHRLSFIEIPKIIEMMLEKTTPPKLNCVADVIDFDRYLRHHTQQIIQQFQF